MKKISISLFWIIIGITTVNAQDKRQPKTPVQVPAPPLPQPIRDGNQLTPEELASGKKDNNKSGKKKSKTTVKPVIKKGAKTASNPAIKNPPLPPLPPQPVPQIMPPPPPPIPVPVFVNTDQGLPVKGKKEMHAASPPLPVPVRDPHQPNPGPIAPPPAYPPVPGPNGPVSDPNSHFVEVPKVIDKDAGIFEFNEDTHNYGEVMEGPGAECDFVFINKGKKAIIINEAHGSCGCTVPSYPKTPIAPGAKATIHVIYNTAGRAGPINKDVIILSNAMQQPMTLHITGTVKAKAK